MGENDWKNVLEEEAKSVANSPSPVMSQLGKLVYDRNHLFGLGSDTETENWPKL